MKEGLTRRAFLKGLVGSLGLLVIEGCQLPTPWEPTPPTTIPGFNEYLQFWKEKVGLELLRSGKRKRQLSAYGRWEIEYRGRNKLFLDWSLISRYLNHAFPRRAGKSVVDKIWWRLTFVDGEKDLPKFARTRLQSQAQNALRLSGLPPETEDIVPLTFTYLTHDRSSQEDFWHTYLQMEPTGKLSLPVKETGSENIVGIPETENPWMARSLRASFLFLTELRKAKSLGGPQRLPRYPVLEITCPASEATKKCQPAHWANTDLLPLPASIVHIRPNHLLFLPAPADFQLPLSQPPRHNL